LVRDGSVVVHKKLGRNTILGLAACAATAAVLVLSSDATQMFIASTAGLVVLPFIFFLNRRHVDLFEPVWFFAILYTIGYGYKLALISANPTAFFTFPQYFPELAHREGVVTLAFYASLLGLAAFYIGYFSNFHRRLVKLMPTMGDRDIAGNRFACVSLIGFGLGVLSLIYFTGLAGVIISPSALFSAEVRNAILGQLLGRGISFFFVFLMPMFGLAILYYTMRSKGARRRLLSGAVFLVTLFTMAFIGGRIQLLGFLVGAFALYHYRVRRLSLRTQIALMLTVGLAGGILGILLAPETYSVRSPYDIVRRLSGTFDSGDQLVIAFDRIENYYWGQTIVEDVAITYVPRAVFPSKPIVYGTTRLQEAVLPGIIISEGGYGGTFPVSVLAEGYANFGLAGLMLVPFATGALLRALYEKSQAHGGMNTVILALALGQALGALRGFGAFLAGIIFVMAVSWLFYIFRVPIRAPARGSPSHTIDAGTDPEGAA
jgi:oligosaccharide repeat unit polymerase